MNEDYWKDRNSVMFYMEDLSAPMTPHQRAALEKFEREQRRLVVRFCRRRRAIWQRLRDACNVLLHGLPEHDQW